VDPKRSGSLTETSLIAEYVLGIAGIFNFPGLAARSQTASATEGKNPRGVFLHSALPPSLACSR
jgi:hypothetical protein